MIEPLQYGGLVRRALAWLLDLLLLSALLSPVLFLVNGIAHAHIYHEAGWMVYRAVRLAVVLAIGLTVLCQTTSRYGGTPGKVLLGLQVLDAQGHWLSPRQALVRVLLSIPAICSGIGVLIMFVDAQRRTFHDRVLNTVVVVKYHDYADDPLPGKLP